MAGERKGLSQNHLLLMLVCCIVPIIAIIFLSGLFELPFAWLVILLCPLMHLLLMRGMHKSAKCHGEETEKKETIESRNNGE